MFFNVFDTNLAILFVQHVSIDPRYMRTEEGNKISYY